MKERTFRGALLRRVEEEALTTTQLGERLGVSQSTASKWTTGRELPGADKVPALASFLEMTETELVLLLHRERARRDYHQRPLITVAETDTTWTLMTLDELARMVQLLGETAAESRDPDAKRQAQEAVEILRGALDELPPDLGRPSRPPRKSTKKRPAR